MIITDKSAREKIVRARTNLLVSNGFFGFLAMHLRLEERTDLPTMAVDGVTMFYAPKFVHELSERELEGVEAHEVMHCCFKHFTRRQHRDPMLWNIAGDFVINADLIKAGFTLPGQPIPLAALGDPTKKGMKGHLLDPQFAGMNTEEVYELVENHANQLQKKFGSGDGLGDGSQDPGGCGGVMDAPGDATKQEATGQTWETAVRTAVAVAKANNAGQIPASLQRLLGELQRPKVSWRDLTRNFIDQSMTKATSWSRISRRSASIGTLMPGLISDRLNHLIFIADTSGSINDKMLNEFLSEVAGALDQGTADQLTVLYADTRVHDVDHFVPGDLVKAGSMEKGGGGTHFADSFKWVRENAPDASCVIYLTDLQTCDFGEDPGMPTLWAVYGSTQSYDQWSPQVPFGQTIHVSNSIG